MIDDMGTMTPEKRDLLRSIERAPRRALRHVGGGPWRVLDYCPAGQHNTLASARGIRRGRGRGDARCVCPRGCDLLAEFRKREHERKRRYAMNKPRSKAGVEKRANVDQDLPRQMLRAGVLQPALRVPDLSSGLCLTPDGKQVVRRLELSTKQEHSKASNEHRAMCGSCPVRIECLANVMRREQRDFLAAWSGMYAGLWPKQRRALLEIVKTLAEQEQESVA